MSFPVWLAWWTKAVRELQDVPSRSSEFAHPDVAIGLTILAYRYEASHPKSALWVCLVFFSRFV